MAKKGKKPRRPKYGTKKFSKWLYRHRTTEKEQRSRRPPRPGGPHGEKKPRAGPRLKAATEIASEQVRLRLSPRDVERLKAVARKIAEKTDSTFVLRRSKTAHKGRITLGEAARELVLWALDQPGHAKAIASFVAEKRSRQAKPSS